MRMPYFPVLKWCNVIIPHPADKARRVWTQRKRHCPRRRLEAQASYRPSIRRDVQWLRLVQDHIGYKLRAGWRHGNTVTIMPTVEIKIGDFGVAIDNGDVIRRTWTQPAPLGSENFFTQCRHQRMGPGQQRFPRLSSRTIFETGFLQGAAGKNMSVST